MRPVNILLFLRQFHDFFKTTANIVVISALVRNHAVRTVFDTVLRDFKITAAAFSERIKRTVA